MRKKISFCLLVLLFLSVWIGLGYVAYAGTIVKSDGSIQERKYKASYLVKNNVQLVDVPYTRTEWKDRDEKIYNEHPLSSIRDWTPRYTLKGDV